ncbi:DNA repair protein rad52 [Linderina macrospora]|uniref:DNA repair protein rad52 n=1 Tax=Linderina macrospora TaxID=4868 RepID=A0ACC1JET9_9FUNG|nr:DNA repair protein rad52 [Linderina macrospora]
MSQYSALPSAADDIRMHVPYTPEEFSKIQLSLGKKLGPEHISTRRGAGNTKLSYVEGWRVISIANEVFGFNGWNTKMLNMTVDFMDINPENGHYSIGVSCTMRVTLKDGTSKEDIGYGMIENVKSKAMAFEKVKKEAVTDALKRAMRQFGNVLGNCVYDKDYLKNVTLIAKQARGKPAGDALFRYSDLEGGLAKNALGVNQGTTQSPGSTGAPPTSSAPIHMSAVTGDSATGNTALGTCGGAQANAPLIADALNNCAAGI